MKQFVLFFLSIFLLTVGARSQEAYQKKVFISSWGDSLNYRLLRPESEKPGQQYPLVLFLHGAGERGNDNEKQLTHGGQMFLNPVNREKYPAFVLVPQCPEKDYWAYASRPSSFVPSEMPVGQEITPVLRAVKELLDTYLDLPSVDRNRVYVVGLSMGGMATYDLAIRFPDIFAAAVPICGTVNPGRLADAVSVRFRIFHGDADNVVPVEGSREAYKALKKLGAEVEYVEFPGCNHGSWNPTFNYPGFMEWLFASRKK